jgi:hypothetical protein
MSLKRFNITLDEFEHRKIKALASLKRMRVGDFLTECVRNSQGIPHITIPDNKNIPGQNEQGHRCGQ